jgi:hypothetical protein
MMVIKSLTFFEDAESDEEPILLDKKLLWINIKDQILSQVRNTIG